ncbi:MAG: 30S ribosomal protein S5 [Parcubacteria group bacterium ADurb.Bin247]|jgi:small subunit ribosomal protein S5|nr:MAG: 30S ribosomal protein S5 [Parcubacteria group bacterium ADurb.Bin247]
MEKEETKNEIESKLLNLSRVERMTGGGRRLRFQAVVAVGDKKSKVGVATAKASDVSQAIDKATKLGKKNMIEVVMSEDTIPHQVEGNFGAAKVLLRPQEKGRGLIAGGTTKIICELAGIKNISAKTIARTGNKLNNAKATILALKKLRK